MLLRRNLKDLKIPFKGSTKIKTNYSEIFQDIFVLQCFNGKKKGTFLEIGSARPIKGNNTYLLHKDFGWDGLSVDYGWDDWNDDTLITDEEAPGKHFTISEFQEYWHDMWNKQRSNNLLLTNAVTCDWEKIIDNNFKKNVIDYLQVDIDPAKNTYKCLERLPFNKIDFKVITYEHDAYVDGDEWRLKSRKFLESKGYVLIAGNVSKEKNLPFEDWWVNLKYINELNPLIKRSIFEESLLVMDYMFNKNE
tara:strand:+ start:196 stop:942 length:747 start_codon:yes stop_codon:yes gene_type:complete